VGLSIVTPPATEPVSLTEAKLHLRVDHTTEDALITALIKAARGYAETATARQLITATWQLTLDDFPSGQIVLPRPTMLGVTEVTYADTAGDEQTLAADQYIVVTDGVFGRIVRPEGVNWPQVKRMPNAVAVQYTAGYGSASAVPEEIKCAIKLMVGHLYENREATVVGVSVANLPLAIADLLAGYMVPSLGYDPNRAEAA
jgi:uncharacterized phiE125 gp8 family phage protein